MAIAGAVVFALTYLLISAGRLSWLGLDRPANALLGAVLCVGLGVLTPTDALAAVDGSTLLLLLGVMGMGAFLAVDGFFASAESFALGFAKTPARLLGLIVWGSGVLAAFVTNDAVCVLGAPVIVRLIQRQRLPPLPFLLAIATAANTGSVATLVGNPQNMLCASLGQLSYRQHLLLVGPVALIGLAINHALLHALFRRELRQASLTLGAMPTATNPAGTRLTLGVIFISAVAYTLGAHLAWSAAAGLVLLMLVHRRDTRLIWANIDGSLLLFFAGLFVVVAGFTKSGVPAWLFAHFPLAQLENASSGLGLASVFLVGSNIVSNVPFILVVHDQMATLSHPRLGWELLAVASTFAGNLTLLGSVANIIVAEAARDIGGISFLQYLRVGFPLAIITTILGALWLNYFA